MAKIYIKCLGQVHPNRVPSVRAGPGGMAVADAEQTDLGTEKLETLYYLR